MRFPASKSHRCRRAAVAEMPARSPAAVASGRSLPGLCILISARRGGCGHHAPPKQRTRAAAYQDDGDGPALPARPAWPTATETVAAEKSSPTSKFQFFNRYTDKNVYLNQTDSHLSFNYYYWSFFNLFLSFLSQFNIKMSAIIRYYHENKYF